VHSSYQPITSGRPAHPTSYKTAHTLIYNRKSVDPESYEMAEMGAINSTELKPGIQDSMAEFTGEKQDCSSLTPGGEHQYITGFRLFLVMFTIFMSTLLASLEIGIISTAIPGITDEFHRLDDVGWYGSSTFLLAGASAPIWGKLYKYLSVKYVYLATVALYFIGSIVGAAAPNSVSVIVGRAIQGFGASGTLGGSVLVINYVAQPKVRPMLIGSWMGVFMISTILGPIIGGALTSAISWRWCFWINLPLGGLIVVLLQLFLQVPKHIRPTPATWKEIILQLDFPGFSVLLASLVCLTLALQWGGQTKAWADGAVIAMLVLAVFFTIAFLSIEWLQADCAMIPLKLLKPRLTWSNAVYSYM
jgi:MFS transporter, DHA2 family, glioxin efflux transporter